jgi:hypothetical protein
MHMEGVAMFGANKFNLIKAASVAAALVGGAMALSTPANAAVFIGLQQSGFNGGAIVQVATDPTLAIFGGSYGTFSINAVSGAVTPMPHLLDTNSINVSGSTGVLHVWVTRTGITSPVGNEPLISSFTENSIAGNVKVTENTYIDAADGKFTGSLMSTDLFTAIGKDTKFSPLESLVAPYSVTTEYIIAAVGVGSANSTINISAIPEVSTWGMMLVGFFGLGALMRTRRKHAAASI